MSSKRFKELKSGYKINVLLVRVVSLFVVAYMLLAGYQIMSHDRYYVENRGNIVQLNPFYQYAGNVKISDELRSMEYLPPHFKAGYNQPFWVSDAPTIGFFILLAGAVFNHFKFNY